MNVLNEIIVKKTNINKAKIFLNPLSPFHTVNNAKSIVVQLSLKISNYT